MKQVRLVISLVFVCSLLLPACSGKSSAPVPMLQYESDRLTLEYPDGWWLGRADDDQVRLMITSQSVHLPDGEIVEGDELGMLFAYAPVAIVTLEAADPDTSREFSARDLMVFADVGPNVGITRQGEIKVNGVKGYELVLSGKLGGTENTLGGMHLAVLEAETQSLYFMGLTTEKELSKNLDIFGHVLKSIDLSP